MKFLQKSITPFVSSWGFNYNKLATCPHCGYGNDALLKESKVFVCSSSEHLLAVTWECTACHGLFYTVNKINFANQSSTFEGSIPSREIASYDNENLKKISPRFIDLYNQALRAEAKDDLDLAAFGFRASLEILVKDYAISELGKDEAVVKKKSLNDSISEYLNQGDLVKAADVVRILGNDYAHYEKKYPEHDFSVLKGYMDIFLNLVETKYKINHPPVARQ